MIWYLLFLGIAASTLVKADSNISLPPSQQPAPLIGFGENIIDKGTTQIYLYADAYLGRDNYTTDLIPSVLYAVRDDLSLYFSVPFALKNSIGPNQSAGIEDIFLQAEYAFYTQNAQASAWQATVVGNVTFPTGSSTKNPPTGWGAPTFFLGSTLNYTGIDWIFFTAYGGIFPLEGYNIRSGNELLYQYGFGRNIPSPSGWIFLWMVEGDGTYSWKNSVNGSTAPNSGGNVFYVTPSLWISSTRTLLQIGVGYPIVQYQYGQQPTTNLSLNVKYGVTF